MIIVDFDLFLIKRLDILLKTFFKLFHARQDGWREAKIERVERACDVKEAADIRCLSRLRVLKCVIVSTCFNLLVVSELIVAGSIPVEAGS